MNHDGYQGRMNLVKDILAEFKLNASDIVPIEYDENCAFPYNNFIYKISLFNPVTPSSFQNRDAYTTKPLGRGVSSLVIRLSNPKAEGLTRTNRIENEVASIYLGRNGLELFKPSLVDVIPAVYAWRSATSRSDGLGWILMEFKDGVPLDTYFNTLSKADQRNVMAQIADIFLGVQQAPLPSTIKSYGGLTINDSGDIVNGQMTTLKGGPWTTYGAFWHTKLRSQLEDADDSPILEGWRPHNIRTRIDKFLTTDLEEFLAKSGVDIIKRTLIHGDLTMNNMLFDPDTKVITALLDFDFTFISHPFQEFLVSLRDVGGNIRCDYRTDPNARLHGAIIKGNFHMPDLPEEIAESWDRAQAWDALLEARATIRPSSIMGVSALLRLAELEEKLCPFHLAHPVLLKRKTQEQLIEARERAERDIIYCLNQLGY